MRCAASNGSPQFRSCAVSTGHGVFLNGQSGALGRLEQGVSRIGYIPYRWWSWIMLPKNEAVAAAAAYLKTFAYPDRADSVVMLPDTAIEFIYGWTVRFDFKEHLETGAPAAAPFSSVIVVPHDGTAAHFAPTFPPTEEIRTRRAWPATPVGSCLLVGAASDRSSQAVLAGCFGSSGARALSGSPPHSTAGSRLVSTRNSFVRRRASATVSTSPATRGRSATPADSRAAAPAPACATAVGRRPRTSS
ncbi:YrhB domain-containing protein [Streptomyces sp. NPDC058755]|uniref:YrhB domain-containing protein n=1 Tax=Streptomyces sp. NPDC058755 TaxID=3346624 RepID=UPI00368C0C24